MTNFERVKLELKVEDIGGCEAIHRVRNEKSCYDRNCKECFDWLMQEYKEPITLTEAEKVLLQNIDKKYKYIVRDIGDNLFLCSVAPYKSSLGIWDCNYEDIAEFTMFNRLFKFVDWKDEEPYLISNLLKEV